MEHLKNRWGVNPDFILHLGANTCQELADYYNNGVERTIWIEADPELFARAAQNCSQYPNASVYSMCIGEKDMEEVVFNISNNESQSSSLFELDYHKVAHPDVYYIKQVRLRAKRMDTFIEENDIKFGDRNLLNVDLQGFEAQALGTMEKYLKNFKWLYVEVSAKPLYTGTKLIDELEQYLATFGFKTKEVRWANSVWGDMLSIQE